MSLKERAYHGLKKVTDRLLSNYALRIPLQHIQSQVAGQFPITREKYLLTMEMKDPLVKLDDINNRIGMEVTIDLKAPGNLKASRRAFIHGRLEYRRAAGELYLTELRVEHPADGGWLEQYLSVVETLAKAAINLQMNHTPIYTLDRSQPVQALLHAVVKTIKVQGDNVVIEFGLD
jgi:hypothetical protein